jgi:hypothetical protein
MLILLNNLRYFFVVLTDSGTSANVARLEDGFSRILRLNLMAHPN